MPNVLRSSEFTPLPISAAAYHTGPGPHCPNQMRSVTGTRSAAPEYGIAPVTHRAPGHQTAVKAYIYSMPNMLRSSEFTPLPISAAAYLPDSAWRITRSTSSSVTAFMRLMT